MQARAGNEPSQSLKFYNHKEGPKGSLQVESTYWFSVILKLKLREGSFQALVQVD